MTDAEEERVKKEKVITKKLGKIEKSRFGCCGIEYKEVGLYVYLSGPGWGVTSTYSCCNPEYIKVTAANYGTESQFDTHLAGVMRSIARLLSIAKVKNVEQLISIPIEATFINGRLKDWRILTEVLI